MRFSRKPVAVVAAAILTVGAAGAAWAAWSAGGSGSGTAKSISAQSIVVSAVTPAADLYPGGPAGKISFKLSNPNPYAVTLTSVAYGAVTSDTLGCDSSLATTLTAPTSISILVPANSTNVAASIDSVVKLDHSAPDACQGAAFDVAISLSGAQN
jgi:hypothetical protein